MRISALTAPLTALSLVLAALGASLQGAAAQSDYDQGGTTNSGSGTGILGTEWTLIAGAGAVYAPDYEGSDDYEFTFRPLVRATWRDMATIGNVTGGYGAEITPFRFDSFSLGFGVAYWGGRDASDNAALAGLGDIGSAVMGTATIANSFALVDARATLLYDFTGDRDGAAVEAGLSAPLITSDNGVDLVAGASATWASENYMANTFGINATQSANSGYAVYDADAGFKDIGASLQASYDVTSQVAVTLRGEVKQLLSDAADSPIVKQQGSATQGSIFAGMTYQF
ncbi:hypothetical protein MNBD_ALPHA09-2260 [hydrothermal vent metagenome]|uniref:Outer membrane protein V n=1 Tax=hydrothermal vent metagenome TaxID=652676 RepID=A0A3B0T0J0_9ZZZZ